MNMRARLLVAALLNIGLSSIAIAAPTTTEIGGHATVEGSYSLAAPSAFSVENATGDVIIHQVQGNQIVVRAKNKTKAPAEVHFDEVGPGKVKMWVEYPNSGNVSGGRSHNIVGLQANSISVSGGNVVISDMVIGSGSRVIINGMDMTANSETDGANVELEIGIPAEMMAHLKVKTQQGAIRLNGAFSSPIEKDRYVDLETSQGRIDCTGVCSLGQLKVRASQGAIAIANVTGTVEATTSQGGIAMSGSQGNAKLVTSQGAIVAQDNTGEIRVETSMGSIRVAGQTGAVIAKSSMGNISLSNPNAAHEEATSNMGRVSGLRTQAGGESCNSTMGRANPFRF